MTGVRIPMDKETGQPKGIAFVEFADAADARSAVGKMDGEPVKGRSLKVNLSDSKSAPRRAAPPPPPPPTRRRCARGAEAGC